jgi:hypothetical protein
MGHPLALIFILLAVSLAAGCGVFDPPAKTAPVEAQTDALTTAPNWFDRLTSP